MGIPANELKVRGLAAIKEALIDVDFEIITDRGNPACIVVNIDQLDDFIEWQLDKAIAESDTDIKKGNLECITDISAYIDNLSHD